MTPPRTHIYVCHHKNGDMFADACFLPIQVGKALTDKDLGILTDNVGDNISKKNPGYCELTAIYWAWKNDTEADWIGLMHYRRFLAFKGDSWEIDAYGCTNVETLSAQTRAELGLNAETVSGLLMDNPGLQALLPKQWSVKNLALRSLEEHYVRAPHHFARDLQVTRSVVADLCPDYLGYFDAAMKRPEGYFTNVFVFRRDIFEAYCQFLFSILAEVENRLDLTNYSTAAKRVYGYLAERLFNVFMLSLADKPDFNALEFDRVFVKDTGEANHFTPPTAPPAEAVTIVIASDGNFVPHLAALVESIKANLCAGRYLEVVVLDGGISSADKNLLQRQFKLDNPHPSRLLFVDCTHLFADVDTHMHFSPATFYRLSLGEILRNHQKAIYIDCDTIVLGDLAELWDKSLEGKAVAAVPDIIMKTFVTRGTPAIREAGGKPAGLYLKEWVGLGDRIDDYFQAGLIVIDLDKFRQLDLANDAYKDLTSKKYWFLDQDVLNKYLLGKVKFLDLEWNYVNMSKDVIEGLELDLATKVAETWAKPKMIHYAGYEAKPWNTPNAPLAVYYWFYLRKTFWYEQITQHFQQTESLNMEMARSRVYKTLRTIWRSLPNWVQRPFTGVAHILVRSV